VELQLQVLSGVVQQLHINLPKGVTCELKEPAPQDERLERYELPKAEAASLVLHLKKASAEPVRVAFQVQQQRSEASVPVGPFVVTGAIRQAGTISVLAPPEYRVAYQTVGDLLPRDVPDEPARANLVAAFAYWSVPATPNPPPQL